MNILVIGRGVIGTQYAWALEQAGNDISFFVRPGRAAQYGNQIHMDILDVRKKIQGKAIKETWAVKMIEELPQNHDFELIIVSVQHYNFKEVVEFLSTRVNKASILIFNNFWKEPLEETAMLPQNQLVWGFPRAGGGFDSKEVLNGAFFRKVAFGTFCTAQTERDKQVIELFENAGFKAEIFSDFRSMLFIHFVVNASFHVELLKEGNGDSDLMKMTTTETWKNAKLNAKALTPLLKARQVDLGASSELKLFVFPAWLISMAVKMAIAFLPPLKKILGGHNNRKELRAFCRDVTEEAARLNIELPGYKENERLFEE